MLPDVVNNNFLLLLGSTFMWLSACARNCRVHNKNEFAALQAQVSSGGTLVVAPVATETLKPIVKELILNQTRGYWILSDALFTRGFTPSYILHTHAFGTYLLGGLFTLQKTL